MRILPTGIALLALNVASAVCAHADTRQMPWDATPPPNLIEDRLRLDINLWNMNINTFLRADPTPSQPGTTLNGESDVGLSKGGIRPDIELTLLPGKRNLIRLNEFSSDRDGTAVLTIPVTFDNNHYAVGQTVKSTLNLDMLGIGYGYRLLTAPRYELDLGLDVQIASIEANVFAPNSGIAPETNQGVVPIPLLDTEGRWELLPKWQLLARYRWLSGHGDNVGGRYSDWRAGVEWQCSQHLAIGLLYRNFNVSVNSSSSSNPGAVSIDFKGLQLGIHASL